MSAYKYIAGLAFLITVLLTINTVPANGSVESYVSANQASHHLIVGFRMPGDKLVLKENIVKNSGWMQVKVIEKTFSVPRGERITMVEALDQKTNGNGAYASIKGGGPGHNNVTMKFKSQRSHGINFVLQLYSRL
ncbi:probable salivary secreted peptide [Temnothorax longispinosus]|uniref:Putative salivary secreted peptide-like protein n=1 Tax=Temnothorax longispinosus TaxID=300112 RepID=A0A4S2JPK6_9HYME|nr:putative salivary secreted peptide-like protein [Temnothorax longispinosus]